MALTHIGTEKCDIIHIRTKNVSDGWMDDLRFYVLSTVFQSYKDDGRLITKGCVQWNCVYG